MKKLIGLTGPSTFTQECMDVIEEFFDANFVLLYHGRDANLHHWLQQVDGVILAGGIDIHPSVYRESVWTNHNLNKFDIKRDCRELNVIEYCFNNRKPILGICRGHQLLGIKHGMGVVMDIASSSTCHQPSRHGIQSDPKEPVHKVKVLMPEVLYGQFGMPQDPPERKVMKNALGEKGGDRIWVNSFHHQAIAYNSKRKYENENIQVIGTARIDLDCCKEIIELMQGPNWISCQWHPEYDWKENSVSRVVLKRFKSMLNGQ